MMSRTEQWVTSRAFFVPNPARPPLSIDSESAVARSNFRLPLRIRQLTLGDSSRVIVGHAPVAGTSASCDYAVKVDVSADYRKCTPPRIQALLAAYLRCDGGSDGESAEYADDDLRLRILRKDEAEYQPAGRGGDSE